MQKYVFKKLLIFVVLFTLNLSVDIKADQNNITSKEIICKSTTIRSVKDFNQLQNCTVLAGYLRIVLMDFHPMALTELKSSNIEEISEYLLVYRVKGLDSLERLFPKLIIIRGVELLYEQYGLVVVENRDLINIGLVSLLRVLKGSIRIESNPLLCFAHTINWVSILGNDTKQYYYDVKNNKSPNNCPLCYTYEDELETKEVNRHKNCWSFGKFQKTSLDYVGGQKCFKQGGKSSCLTSCSDRNCRHCTNFVSDEGCVENCLPPKYRLAFKRQCVTNCTELGLIQLGLECVEKCPPHYHEIKIGESITCALNCDGNFVIHNIEDLKGLADCTTIDGSLTIEIHETHIPIITHLENAFRHLNEITGYLKILNSPQILSLHFFKNLHTIRGSELLENRYSLYVVDNNYLQELWLGNVAILHGCVYFHLNPRLCYEKITDLQKNFKECQKITITDASEHSNGERVVCGEDLRLSNASITDVNSNSAVVEVDLLSSNELLLLVGYVYYYKEAPYKNVTKYDGRHGCGRDGWFTDVVLKKQRRHILQNLKPATQYAYFVNSLTVMDFPYSAEHVSQIQYFTTLPSKPGIVAKLYSHSLSTTEIELHWWPPRIKNGILEKYILQYEETNATMLPDTGLENKSDVCLCPKLDTESHIPTPNVENYYSKEQLLNMDSIMNFIYVKKRKSNDSSTTTKSKRSILEAELAFEINTSDPNSTTSKWKRDTKEPEQSLEERYRLILKKLEEKAFSEQEENKETYVIPHPYPICDQPSPNIQEQAENKCVPLEKYDGAIEIPGQQHSYILHNLEAEKTYRIGLRACVKDLENGCGAEKVILAVTVSKRLESLIENFSFHRL